MRLTTRARGRVSGRLCAGIVRLSACLPLSAQESPSPPQPAPPAPIDPIEARLREMEQTNRRLAEQLEQARRQHDEQMQLLLQEMSRLRNQVESGSLPPPPPDPNGGGPAATNGATSGTAGAAGRRPVPRRGVDTPGPGAVPGYGISGSTASQKTPLSVFFGPGFELSSRDEEYQLQLHQEIQFDAREFDPNGDQYARSGFVFPRVRAFANGRL